MWNAVQFYTCYAGDRYSDCSGQQSISQTLDLGHSGNGTLIFAMSKQNGAHNNSQNCSSFSFQVILGDKVLYRLDQNNESLKKLPNGFLTYVVPVKVKTQEAGKKDIKFVWYAQASWTCQNSITLMNIKFYYRKDVFGGWFTAFIVFDALVVLAFIIGLCYYFCNKYE